MWKHSPRLKVRSCDNGPEYTRRTGVGLSKIYGYDTSFVIGNIMDRVAFPDPGIFAVPAPTESIFSRSGILCELGHKVGSRGLHCNEAAAGKGYVSLKPLS